MLHEIVSSRRFSVLRERLFRAFADPAELSRWWGSLRPQTIMTWRMRFASAKQHEQVRSFVTAANEQNFDRLEALLAAAAS